MTARLPKRDWSGAVAHVCGSGSVRILAGTEGYAIEIDGVQRVFRSTWPKAVRTAERLFLELLPESSCPACGKYVTLLPGGVVPGHHQPRLHKEAPRWCPGGRLEVGEGT